MYTAKGFIVFTGISLSQYLIFGAILFCVGITGTFINRKNVITLLMSLELIFLAANTNLVACAKYWNDMTGQIFVLFIFVVVTIETVIGLAILVALFKSKYASINIDNLNLLQG